MSAIKGVYANSNTLDKRLAHGLSTNTINVYDSGYHELDQWLFIGYYIPIPGPKISYIPDDVVVTIYEDNTCLVQQWDEYN